MMLLISMFRSWKSREDFPFIIHQQATSCFELMLDSDGKLSHMLHVDHFLSHSTISRISLVAQDQQVGVNDMMNVSV